MHGTGWYGYVYPKNIEVMASPKILVPDIASQASFALDVDGAYAFTSGYGITLRSTTRESMYYVVGLLNSRLLDFYLKHVSTTLRGGFFRYFSQFVERLPIRRINFTDQSDKSKYDQLVYLVERIMSLNASPPALRAPDERTRLQRQIDAAGRKIDQLVYELYGLTDKEIALVEAADK